MANIAITDETISAIAAPGVLRQAVEIVDVTGMHVIPRAIDMHVHFRVPGYGHKADWETGMQATAMGGVTCVFEMPNTDPPTRSVTGFCERQAVARKASVDFGLYGLLVEDSIAEIPGLIEAGADPFNCFMGNSFGNLPSASTGAMLEGFEIIAQGGRA